MALITTNQPLIAGNGLSFNGKITIYPTPYVSSFGPAIELFYEDGFIVENSLTSTLTFNLDDGDYCVAWFYGEVDIVSSLGSACQYVWTVAGNSDVATLQDGSVTATEYARSCQQTASDLVTCQNSLTAANILADMVPTLQADLGACQAGLATSQTNFNACQTDLIESQTGLAQCEQDLLTLTTENQTLTNELTETTLELANTTNQLQDIQELVIDLQQEIATLLETIEQSTDMENIRCLMERLRNSTFGAKTVIVNNDSGGGGSEEPEPETPNTGLSEADIKCKIEELKKCKTSS